MAADMEEELHLVQVELSQVQDQISTLIEHQERLLERQEELRHLLSSQQSAETYQQSGNLVGDPSASKEDWGGCFEWGERAADVRLNVFGISSYRQNQQEIINAVMSGRDVVVIMAAGGGKSLCYQLPALLRPGTALVISPLLSLIQDQVMGLTALGIPASSLTSTTSKDEEKTIYSALEKGIGELRILYVTPEKIAKSKRFMSKLEKCNHAGRLSLLAIDEAHCCSQWGHDFRPDYKNLGILKKQFPHVPMIALTATATERVQTDLREMLQMLSCVKFVSSINRPNLFYEVRDKKPNANAAIDDIAEFIHNKYKKMESGIVYCFTRRECEQVAEELRRRGISAAHYHADMVADLRTNIHKRWSSNKVQVIVGTVAFGMGINKPDVRFVVHHSLSKSLETYYQESGRAGRDGLPSHCLLFFRPADVPRQSSMVFAEVAGLHNLYSIVRFCQSRKGCRRASFFLHFGEPVQDCNGMCDNCSLSKDVVDMNVTAHAKSVVTLVKELDGNDQKLTMLQLVDKWKSKSHQSGASQDHSSLAKELSKDDVERVITQLILDDILKEEFQHTAYATNSYIALGSSWRSLLQGQRKIILEGVEGVKLKKQKNRAMEDQITQSGLAHVLDVLRQSLANSHGSIFPHSVLSSQHILELCARKPDSLEQVEAVVGKRKSEQYGQIILEAIKVYAQGNHETPPQSGIWISPKGGKATSSTCKPSLSKRSQLQSSNARSSMAPLSTHSGKGGEQSCINLDTESEREDNENVVKSKNSDENDCKPIERREKRKRLVIDNAEI